MRIDRVHIHGLRVRHVPSVTVFGTVTWTPRNQTHKPEANPQRGGDQGPAVTNTIAIASNPNRDLHPRASLQGPA